MIGRIWHGWTTLENADRYEKLLKEEIFAGIAGRDVPGYKGIQLFRRPSDDGEVEFVTIMRFDSWDAVKRFAGEDYEQAYVPPAAWEVLSRFDQSSQTVTSRGSVSSSMSTSTSSPAATPALMRFSALIGSMNCPRLDATVLR